MTLEELEKTLVGCTRCSLHTNRQHFVFGYGVPTAKILFVGESPGEGVSPVGPLVECLLLQAGIPREECYFTTLVKCSSSCGPEQAEIHTCYPFLQHQIRILQPNVLVGFGCTVVSRLAQQWGKMGILMKLPDLMYSEEQIPIVVLYHPSYLLRASQRQSGAMVLQDTLERLKLAKRVADQPFLPGGD